MCRAAREKARFAGVRLPERVDEKPGLASEAGFESGRGWDATPGCHSGTGLEATVQEVCLAVVG